MGMMSIDSAFPPPEFSATLAKQFGRWQSTGHIPIALKAHALLKTEKYRKLLEFGIELERRMPDTLGNGFIDDLKRWISSGQASASVLLQPEMEEAYRAVVEYVNRGDLHNASLGTLARFLHSNRDVLPTTTQPALDQGDDQTTFVGQQPDLSDMSDVSLGHALDIGQERARPDQTKPKTNLDSSCAEPAYSALIIGAVVMLQILVIYFSLFR